MKQLAKVLASFSLAATMCLGVGFAADSPHPGEHGTVDKAMVSEETDKAYDEKPNMGTKFNLYLAPDIPETVPPIKKDVPKMGDTGIPQESLLQALLVAGGCYLVSDVRLSNGVNAVAHSCYDRRTPGKKDDVSFVVTKLDEERSIAVGIITRIIRQNL